MGFYENTMIVYDSIEKFSRYNLTHPLALRSTRCRKFQFLMLRSP